MLSLPLLFQKCISAIEKDTVKVRAKLMRECLAVADFVRALLDSTKQLKNFDYSILFVPKADFTIQSQATRIHMSTSLRLLNVNSLYVIVEKPPKIQLLYTLLSNTFCLLFVKRLILRSDNF